jgi:PAS domain S-box-containing protein
MKTPLRILHLEDNPHDADLVRITLTTDGLECELVRVDTQADFQAALDKGGWDLILADYELPDFNGETALALAHARCPAVPFVFCLGSYHKGRAIEVLEQGATDYVLKSDLDRLAYAIRRAVHTVEEQIQREQAQAALRDSENRYRLLFDHANDAIFIHDQAGRFLEVNRAACEQLGYSRQDLLRLTVKDIDTLEFAALIPARAEQMRQHGRVVFETAHVRRDGTVIPVEVSSCSIEFAEQPAVLSLVRDITERKRTEEQLRKFSWANGTKPCFYRDYQYSRAH